MIAIPEGSVVSELAGMGSMGMRQIKMLGG